MYTFITLTQKQVFLDHARHGFDFHGHVEHIKCHAQTTTPAKGRSRRPLQPQGFQVTCFHNILLRDARRFSRDLHW
jgi:hypothetical protein